MMTATTILRYAIRFLRRHDKGAAAVEFALMVPVLMLVSVGVADFALIMNENMVLSNAANAGAHYALADSSLTEAQIEAVVEEAGNFNAANLTVTVNWRCECADGTVIACTGVSCTAAEDDSGEGDMAKRQYVVVTVTESYSTLFSYPWLESPQTLTGYAEMRVN